ncbi:hypothetical protein, conserved [Entamoeba dispar SAW760]|uniref:AIG1-type G domain-containing protein n=1 Tax=Entamoeba dispar (strain ATCC PRA-260 / SAW760) TaxID=370354 RepID=B0E9A0_ENTDS|nr:uncharacterized protein EDI_249490 [Entamoeba dispar SAW760]EDR28929.1 hypothetical protein, conserved [Entamoeba dispar SAW760]|eukprot:EDR28929.1 hypothetical protein, conserved [Entamoeba dispar SAW760]
MKQTKLIILGSTGSGKSALCNFILKKAVFNESDNPQSVAKETNGTCGEGDRQDVFVIDTPGLQDSEGRERQYMNQMVEYIKGQKGLQAIVIVLDINQDRFAQHIKTMIKIIRNVFPITDFWRHVCIVWTKCYCYIPKEVIEEKKRSKVGKYQEELMKVVNETTGTTENIEFPMYFVDSKGLQGFDNTHSEDEIVKMLTWVRSLTSINVEEVKKGDPVYQSIIEEKDKQEKVIKQEKNIKTIEIQYLRRNKRITYTGEVSYTNWEVENTEIKEIILPKEPIGTRKETKNEVKEIGRTRNYQGIRVGGRKYAVCGPKTSIKQLINTTLHKEEETFERTITVFNDGTTTEGPWISISKRQFDEII